MYRKDKTYEDHINWRCRTKGCNGRLTTTASPQDGEVPTKIRGDHLHPPQPADAEVAKLQNRIVEKAMGTRDPPRRIIADEVVHLSQEAAVQVRTNRNLSAMINRKRKRQDCPPPTPQSRSGFIIPPEYTHLESGEQFLLHDSGAEDDSRILIFATPRMLDVMDRYPHWFADGTFKVSPEIFYQLFTLHVLVQDTVIPCVYALLPNKTAATYTRFWNALCESSGKTFQPQSILTDFEQAAFRAIETAFPETRIAGCLFHLGQSLWRKIQQNGLTDEYVKCEETRSLLKSLLALAFLPEEKVPGTCTLICHNYSN